MSPDLPNDRPRRPPLALLWCGRGCLIALAVLWIVARPRLAQRVGGIGLQTLAFDLGFALFLAALLVTGTQLRKWGILVRNASRRAPLRALWLLVNMTLSALLVLNICTEWGVIGLMIGIPGACLWIGLLSQSHADSVADSILRRSPLTFTAAFLALLLGEAYLQVYPEKVGGGGGGNPALGQLYADLYQFNSLGLRGEEIPTSPPDEVFRILAVGDSFTFGQGVVHDSTYPQLLESMIRNIHGPDREVVNAGKTGANTVHEVEWLQETGMGLDPDLILLQFYLNDVQRQARTSERATNDWIDRWIKRPFHGSYVVFKLRRTFDGAVSALVHRGTPVEFRDFAWTVRNHIRKNTSVWRECAQSLLTLKQLSKDHNVPVVLVLFPRAFSERGKPHPANQEIHAEVAAFARRHQIPVLDLIPALAHLPPSEMIVSRADHHPSPSYHQVAAEALFQFLRQHDFLNEETVAR